MTRFRIQVWCDVSGERAPKPATRPFRCFCRHELGGVRCRCEPRGDPRTKYLQGHHLAIGEPHRVTMVRPIHLGRERP